jgi:ABC-type sugar transport system permease subunit
VTGYALAIALNAKIKWRSGLRTIFFMPMVLSGLIASYIFTFIISTSVPIISAAIHFAPLESNILERLHDAAADHGQLEVADPPGRPVPVPGSVHHEH